MLLHQTMSFKYLVDHILVRYSILEPAAKIISYSLITKFLLLIVYMCNNRTNFQI